MYAGSMGRVPRVVPVLALVPLLAGCSSSGPATPREPRPSPYLWAAPVDGIRQGPLEADGERVYITDLGGLYAFDGKTGDLLWEVEYSTGGLAAAGYSVLDGLVTFPAAAGAVLRAADGRELWRSEVYGWTGGADGLFAVTGGELVAVDPASGEVRWRAAVPGPAAVGASGPGAGEGVACASRGVEVTCFRAADGTALWSADVGPFLPERILVTGGTVVVRTAEDWFGIAVATGDPAWRRGLEAGPFGLVAGGGTIFLCADRCRAVDAADGTDRWTLDVPPHGTGRIALADGILYVPEYNGALLSVDAATGEVLTRRHPPYGSGYDQAAAGGGRVYAVSRDSLVAYQAP